MVVRRYAHRISRIVRKAATAESARRGMGHKRIVAEFVERLKDTFGERLVSVILFGSVARGTASEYSDVDLLVIAEGLPESRIERQKILSAAILEAIDRYYIRVCPVLLEPSDVSTAPINPLIYGVLTGYTVIYDPKKFWADLLKSIRPAILKTRPEYIEDKRKWKVETLV